MLNNQKDGEYEFNFIDANKNRIVLKAVIIDEVIYLREVKPYFTNQSLYLHLFTKNKNKTRLEGINIGAKKISSFLYRGFSNDSGKKSIHILDSNNNFILKDDIIIEEQPKIKLLEQHQFTDTFHPEAFEVTSNVQAPYLTYKVTDLVCKKSFHIDFPRNYFTDENRSCDVNQIYMENNQRFYSLRTPSSINFVTHPHSQISTFKVITGNNKVPTEYSKYN